MTEIPPVVDITKEEAAAEIRKAAHYYDDPDHPDFGRTLIHAYRGPFGADWDLDAALLAVSKATRCAWVDDLTGHNLWTLDHDGKVVAFDCKRPVDAAERGDQP